MVTLKTSDLRKFVSLSSHIKDTRILPIYGYIKIEVVGNTCTLYKTNGHSFIIFSATEPVSTHNDVILIEETILYGFVSNCSATYIDISAEGMMGLLNDKKRPTKFQAGDPAHFPAIQPKEQSEGILLDSDLLASLYHCKKHTLPPMDKSMREWNCFVHVSKVDKKYGVAGFNGFTFYFHIYKNKLPDIAIDPDIITVISKLDSVIYSVSGNYDMYSTNGVTYGFIISEQKARDLTKLFENLSKGIKKFSVRRKALVGFCESVISMNNTNVPPTISVSDGGKKGTIILKHSGIMNLNIEETVWVENKKGVFDEWHFDPRYIILSLKDLEYDEVTVSTVGDTLVFSSDEEPNYLGGVMRIMPPVNQ